jgi:hypothetical protein
MFDRRPGGSCPVRMKAFRRERVAALKDVLVH